jgi:NADPH2:quinone reductase
MRAIEISRPGPPEVLQACSRPQPTPGSGEVLIRVRAAGVNRPDVLQRLGQYRAPPGASDLPGLEVAGEIVDGDAQAGGFSIGDRVCALTPGGGYAEYVCAPAAHCLPIPHGWSDIEGASLPETCFTVWSNVFERARLAPGESLLVQGGSSGIGVTAIQIARALGHRVFATAGSDDKCRACEQLGAERAINYRDADFVTEVRALTTGRGVDVILDMVGGDYVAREIGCLADDGRLVFIGLLGGAQAQVPLAQILLRRLTLTGSTLRPRSIEYKASLAQALRTRVWPLIEAGTIRPIIHASFPLEQAAQAHRLMESSAHIGKIVLTVSG